MTINECANWLKERDVFLIISHQRPDGDTLCSGAALCSALRRLGKTADCFDNPETTSTYTEFISGFTARAVDKPACVVAVDIADTILVPENADFPVDLAIDHHPSNSNFAANLCLDASKSSCGELVLEIIKCLCGGITAEEANLLYVAVSTDTGCFCYLNTNAATLRAAAELLEMGADNKKLNTLLFRRMTRARMTLEGMIYSGLRYYMGGKVVASMITLEMINDSGATESDCEDLAGIAGKAEGRCSP
jgi:phosphoesterase RecJ-like protein